MKRKCVYLVFACLSLLALVLYINSIFTEIKQYNIDMQLKSDEALVNKLGTRILERFLKSEQDATFIAGYLSQNLSLLGNTSFPDSRAVTKIMQNILPSFLNANAGYQEISFLDKDGRELFVAGGNQVKSTVPADKSQADYFQGVIRHKAEEVYVSFDSNSVYISSPIYNDTEFSGAVALTMPKARLLAELQAAAGDQVLLLIEDTGKYVLTSNQQAGQDFIADYSAEVLDTIKNSATGYTELAEGRLLTFVPLLLDDHQWFLITEADKDVINANTSVLHRKLIVILIFIFMVILVLLGFWSISYKKAIQVEQLRSANDELENLNSQLRRQQTELEEQTAVVEELNAQLEEESKRFHRQKDTLQAIIDSVETGLAMTDITGKIIFMNKVWERNFQYELATDKGNMPVLTGRNFNIDRLIQDMVAGAVNAGQVSAEMKRLADNFEESYLGELEYSEPAHRYCQISSLPCRSAGDQALGRIFLYSDITRIKEIDQLKSELISTVSHELRTPMSSIMGFSELLLTRELTAERARKYVEIIHEQAERLTKLISDFLDIQRMESGRQVFQKKRFDFVHIVDQAIELFSNQGGIHRVIPRFNKEEPRYIQGDQDKLLQLMSNLLSNAVKYSPQGGEITVEVAVQEGMLQTAVSDHGLGIPSDAISKLFTKFYRVDNDDRREIGGTGLGLALCKEIVQAHGGKIWAESAYGEGSTFYFILPLAEPVASGFDGTVTAQNDLDKTEADKDIVLIVEDDRNLINLIETVLQEDGYGTFAVTTGEDALEAVGRAKIKIIILDIKLAGRLNGWDVVKALKDKEKTANIPVIISSIYENRLEPRSQGVSDYLVKPFKPEQLLNAVHKAMRENVEAKMLINGDESLDEHVINILGSNGIRVKELKRTDNILIITLDREI